MISILSVQPGAGHGAETVLSELLNAWPQDADSLWVITPPGSSVYESAAAAGHRVVPFPALQDTIRSNWAASGDVASTVAGTRRVHAWTARGFEGARRLAGRLKVPGSATLHDHPRAAFHGGVRRRVMRQVSAGFDGLVCVSDAVRAACVEAGYRCPLSVIRNGLVDGASGRMDASRLRLGFLGMYAGWKGFAVVDEWARALGETGVEWRLYGEVGQELAAGAEALVASGEGKVQLLGRRPTAEIFGEIDVLVHASSGFDPLPTVLIEAARAGIPCVACDHGGAREIVEEGVTGFLFPPTDPGLGLKKLRELITDSALRMRQSAAARQRFEREFGVERMVREYADFWSARPAENYAAK